MDLFTYLMGKNDKNLLPHSDLFSYLLGKNSVKLQTASGTEISIISKRGILDSLELNKLSTQETTTGKNLFNKNQISTKKYLNSSGEEITDNSFCISDYIAVIPGENYTYQGLTNVGISPHSCYYDENKNFVSSFKQAIGNNTITISNDIYYVRFTIRNDYQADDVPRFMIEKGSTATSYEPYTGGIPAPNPDYPQEVKTVKGYRNLFDEEMELGTINVSTGENVASSTQLRSVNYIPVKPNTKYFITSGSNNSVWTAVETYQSDKSFLVNLGSIINNSVFTTPENCYFIRFYLSAQYGTIYNNNIIITEGTSSKPYVPYGTNWIYTTITNGTNTKYIILPLNDNEICGIDTYKDEYIVDKNGHCYLNKKIGKKIINENQVFSRDNEKTNSWRFYTPSNTIPNSINNISLSNYFENKNSTTITNSDIQALTVINSNQIVLRINKTIASTSTELQTWLSTHNVEVYYVLNEPSLIDLNYTVDMNIYKGANTITNSENADMTIQYY